jgi:hypothetical protein
MKKLVLLRHSESVWNKENRGLFPAAGRRRNCAPESLHPLR